MQMRSVLSSTRRGFFGNLQFGLGAIALTSLLNRTSQAESTAEANSDWYSPESARVKRVIWLFMHGGPSHMDLFDPKPDLERLSGKPVPESFGAVKTRRKVAANPLLGPVKPFRRHGQSGLEISDFLPCLAKHADDLCVIRSMHGDSVNHPQSVYQMNTGNILMGRPSVGSWVSYGLGTENQELPAFVVLPDPKGGLKGGPPAWGNGYLPANFQGVTMRAGEHPILHLKPPGELTVGAQQHTHAVLERLNRTHLERRVFEDELSARIKAYELAFRMQMTAPELVDLSQESYLTKRAYGIEEPTTRDFGSRCLLARRMIERGVRFVQVYSGDTNGWDAHSNVLKNHTEHCQATDQPVAALLADLKQRGLWDDTLVIWGGEFGRMPMSESGTGRDHNPWGYCLWLAGGGIRGGQAYGATDEIGLRAAENKVHIRDFHATVLSLLGIDPLALSYYHNGLDERLVGPLDEQVRVVSEVFA
ncbi:MAG: DUF1501 domain-containing protein [Planctomycetales bacterium]|nr:DUF1501 domain-containing protein [Planctomycetales bacterium]